MAGETTRRSRVGTVIGSEADGDGMARPRGFTVNVCECCGSPVYPWVPLPTANPFLSLPECMECGMLTCMMCRLDHVLGHDHRSCGRARPRGE